LLGGSGLAGPLVALLFAVAVPLPASAPALPVIGTVPPDGARTISFYNLHTKERLTVTYKSNGRYDSAAMEKINHILRDWRRDEATRMDPEVIDLVYEIHHELGSKEPIGIVSGYRSPATNVALRRRSSGVAKHSQHLLGKAVDVYFPDVPLARLREVALMHEEGGVGYYPASGRPFVHIDTGRVRHWPSMPREQLARLFPDGDTLHIPADGKPLGRKVRTQDVRVAQLEKPAPKSAVTPKRRSEPPILVARADPAAPLPNADGNADSGADSGFSLSLFGFNAIEEPAAAPERRQGALVAGLQLPEGSLAPMPTPRPELEIADSSEDPPLTITSLLERAPADSGEDEPLTIASLPQSEPADTREDDPLTTASLTGPEPADTSEDEPLTTASLTGPEPADTSKDKPLIMASLPPAPEPEPADSGKDEPLTTASLTGPEPADTSEDKPLIMASLPPAPEPEPADSGKDEPLTTASLPQRELEPAPSGHSEPLATAWLSDPEPAAGDAQPRTVARLWLSEPEPADSKSGAAPIMASPPPPAPPEERPVGSPVVLASLGPAPAKPAAERPVFKRDVIGIWTGGMRYEPPAVDPLVADWRVHGEAFAAFTAPDQTHLASLMRAPAQSLSISFSLAGAQTPYAEAFVGAAVAPLQVADLAAPLVTAAR